MRRIVSGIVMDINKNNTVIMTKTGEFVSVEKPSCAISLGQEITSKAIENRTSFRIKYAAIAAAILIMLIPFTYFTQAMATVAYVNVDINPSLEIGINKYNNVTSVRPLNDDAKKLVGEVGLKGLNIDDALQRIIQTAGDMGYINDSKDNTIEIALIDLNPGKLKVSEDHLIEHAQASVEKLDVNARIKINGADRKEHDAANEENISTNKYLDQNNNKPEKEVEVKKQPSDNNDNKAKDSKSSNGNSSGNSNKPAKNDSVVNDSSSNGSQDSNTGNTEKKSDKPVNNDKISSPGSQDKSGDTNSNSSKEKPENNNKSNGSSNNSQKSDSNSTHGNSKK